MKCGKRPVENEAIQLKTCPFCGGNAVITRECYRPPPELCKKEGHLGQYISIPRSSVNDGWLAECVRLCETYGRAHYIKDDLRAEMEGAAHG